MKLLAFAASNSRQSINKQLVTYAASLVENATVDLIDLNDYEMPIYSMDRENESGIPQLAKDFLSKIAESDAVLISFAEHNGNYSVAFKNIMDWASRITGDFYQNKPLVFLATSPGARGAKTVLGTAMNAAQFFAGNVVGSLSVPRFNENFDEERGCLTDESLKAQLLEALQGFQA